MIIIESEIPLAPVIGIVTGAIALCVVVVRELFSYLREKKNGNGNGNGKSGSLDPAFWLAQFEQNRQANAEAVRNTLAPLVVAFDGLKDANEKGFEAIGKTLTEIRDFSRDAAKSAAQAADKT